MTSYGRLALQPRYWHVNLGTAKKGLEHLSRSSLCTFYWKLSLLNCLSPARIEFEKPSLVGFEILTEKFQNCQQEFCCKDLCFLYL